MIRGAVPQFTGLGLRHLGARCTRRAQHAGRGWPAPRVGRPQTGSPSPRCTRRRAARGGPTGRRRGKTPGAPDPRAGCGPRTGCAPPRRGRRRVPGVGRHQGDPGQQQPQHHHGYLVGEPEIDAGWGPAQQRPDDRENRDHQHCRGHRDPAGLSGPGLEHRGGHVPPVEPAQAAQHQGAAAPRRRRTQSPCPLRRRVARSGPGPAPRCHR